MFGWLFSCLFVFLISQQPNVLPHFYLIEYWDKRVLFSVLSRCQREVVKLLMVVDGRQAEFYQSRFKQSIYSAKHTFDYIFLKGLSRIERHYAEANAVVGAPSTGQTS